MHTTLQTAHTQQLNQRVQNYKVNLWIQPNERNLPSQVTGMRGGRGLQLVLLLLLLLSLSVSV